MNGKRHGVFLRKKIKAKIVQLILFSLNRIMIRAHVPSVKGFIIKDEYGVRAVDIMDAMYTEEINACIRGYVMISIEASALSTYYIRSQFS